MEHLFKSIERVLAVLAGIALLIMMVLTFVDVIGRYGFNNSIFGTSEIIELLMVVVIFAGIAFVIADLVALALIITFPILAVGLVALLR